MNKKGYMYFIEIIFAVLIIGILFSAIIPTWNNSVENQIVAQNSYTAFDNLRLLDDFDILNDFESPDWPQIEDFVSGFIYAHQEFDLEYCYPNSSCYAVNSGSLNMTPGSASPGNLKANFNKQDLASAQYTYRDNTGNWSTVRLYIWDKI
jgi:hypothetical protein|tara:strand:+ start:633 stop:1082 length:450 start_codon:yes stop_codon:yes gene_type:complete